MTRQADLFDFEEGPDVDVDVGFRGPTMREPLPDAEIKALHRSGDAVIDERELPGTGLSLSDITDWPYINRERDDPEEREHFREMMDKNGPTQSREGERAGLDDGPAPPHPDAGGYDRRVATDGGEVVESGPEPGAYEPGDTVLLIENVAVGRNMSPNLIEGEVSNTGKSVMIPEDADSIHGSRRLDAETIFAGESEYRDSTGYELYTPGRYRNTQRANHAPGPQTGANQVSEVDDLPDPTHLPEGDDPDDAPEECPECGAAGPWHDVGKPRCERCGETVDPGEEENEEETDDTPDKWDLSQLEAGDTLIIEGYSGEFVITRIRYMRGTNHQQVNRLEAAKREGGTWRSYEIEKLSSMKGPRLKVDREGAEPSIMIDVDDPDHARDFEVTGHDEEKRRRYIRDRRRD